MDGSVHRLTLRVLAVIESTGVNVGEVPSTAPQGGREALRFGFRNDRLGEFLHAWESLVVLLDQLASFAHAKADSELLRKPELGNTVQNRIVEHLRQASFLFRDGFAREHRLRGHGVNIFALVKGADQLRFFAEVSQNAEFNLAVVQRGKRVALSGFKRFANASTKLGADRNVLKIGIVRRQSPGGGARLVVSRVDPAIFSDHPFERVGVG